MSSILETIIENKKEELRKLYKERRHFEKRSDPRRNFANAISKRPKLSLIAEIKKASPSRGIIAENVDSVKVAKKYELSGAAAISVLTEERFFKGSVQDYISAREAIKIPVLRKDFIIDPIQIEQSADINADAILLIVAALSDQQMAELYAAAREYDIEVLAEVHNAKEFDRLMKLQPALVGINNRDLTTFQTSIQTTLELMPIIPPQISVVSESGIHNGNQSMQLINAGVSAILVGESLMKRDDPTPLIKELLHAGED